MIARLLICPDTDTLREEIQKILALHLESANVNHPDLLRIQGGEKLGIAEAKKIKEFFSLKPYSAKGRVVVLEDTLALTREAQNALLKTIEELPGEALLILGASSDANLLPTILSRCQITYLDATDLAGRVPQIYEVYTKNLENLLNSNIEERFEYIEKLKEKEEFLHSMVYFFRQKMVEPITHAGPSLTKLAVTNFLKELLRSEEWARQNVAIRAILEYLMLVMPQGK